MFYLSSIPNGIIIIIVIHVSGPYRNEEGILEFRQNMPDQSAV